MKMHITANYLLNPTHPITINLIGCGGTGSQVLTSLGRMDYSLRALGQTGFHVRVYDGDRVSPSNVGRQLFSDTDTGLNKAVLLTTRVNRFFGTSWQAIAEMYCKNTARNANITITCTDTVKSRIEISKLLKQSLKDNSGSYPSYPFKTPYYWLDFGNLKDTGQVVLGTLSKIKQPPSTLFDTVEKLPVITERFNLEEIDETDSGPSCSHADALRKQNLFINSCLAHLGIDLLWQLLTVGMIDAAGLYLNLKKHSSNPIPL